MASTPEGRIQTYWLKTLATESDVYALNQHGGAYTSKGVPDILACVSGTFVGIEVKTPRGTATPVQCKHLSHIAASGGFGFLVSSTTCYVDVLDYIRGHDRARFSDVECIYPQATTFTKEEADALSAQLRATDGGFLVFTAYSSVPPDARALSTDASLFAMVTEAKRSTLR